MHEAISLCRAYGEILVVFRQFGGTTALHEFLSQCLIRPLSLRDTVMCGEFEHSGAGLIKHVSVLIAVIIMSQELTDEREIV